jgi:hypothetical protein
MAQIVGGCVRGIGARGFIPLAGGNLPIYDLAAVADAVNMEPKQLDNLLSRNQLPGVERKKRGVARRLNTDVTVVICLARELSQAFEISIGSALRFAQIAIRSEPKAIELGPFMSLHIDRAALRTAIAARLDAAVEAVGRRRRGRPRSRRT